MMTRLLFICLSCYLLACQNQPGTNKNNDEDTVRQRIFPVSTFLMGQVHEVDSLKLPLIKSVTVNNRTDSSLISMDEFKTLADEFIKTDIFNDNNRKLYKESSFADQSIPSVTINYTTASKDVEVQRMDVIIQPDPVISDKVQSIYMEKLSKKNDTSLLKKMFWKAGENFQIITSKQVGNEPATFNQLKVTWSPKD